MTHDNSARRGVADEQTPSKTRQPWHAPEFFLVDVEATEGGLKPLGPDHGQNSMS